MSRLYPGWGSGKGAYEALLVCHSFAVGGHSEGLECGDKVILPQESFREVSRLKLPFPLVFEVCNPRGAKQRKSSSSSGSAAAAVVSPTPSAQQYCGVHEFSAPPDTVFLPNWIMRNLRLREGSKVKLKSKSGLPKGQSVKIQPHSSDFVDLAAAYGPQYLLEAA